MMVTGTRGTNRGNYDPSNEIYDPTPDDFELFLEHWDDFEYHVKNE